MLRDWGQAERYRHVLPGYNYRMDAIQGAVLTVKLRYLEQWTEARRDAAAAYQALLADLPIGRPAPGDRNSHVWHVYAVRVAHRDRLRAQLAEAGISTGIHYPVPVHLQPAYAGLGYRRGDFPVSEQLADQTLSLPMFPELTPAQIERVCAMLDATGAALRGCADAA
jgi:dTDP-4-amino-4,6-dideoxygalactose transaminase